MFQAAFELPLIASFVMPPLGETVATAFHSLPPEFARKTTDSHPQGKTYSIQVFVVVPRFWRSMGDKTDNSPVQNPGRKSVLVSEPERNTAAE